jgi:hypothetical protein
MYGGRELVAGEGPVKRFLLQGPTGSRLTILVWTLLGLALAFPVIPLVRHLGRSDLSFPAFSVAFVLWGVIIVSVKLCTQWWFWATMIPVAGAHVVFILRVPWPEWVPPPILIAFALADAFVIFYLLYLVGKLMGKEALVKESFSGGKRTGN